MADESDEYYDSGLTPEDYKKHFLFDWKWMTGVFLTILITLSALFYWFTSTMRANSNKRIREAVVMIDKFEDTGPKKMSPLTLELEEMRVDTYQNRDFATETLLQDTYVESMNKKLKRRFLKRSFHRDLPSDWKNQLPQPLKQWKRKRDKRQVSQLRARLARLPNMIEENRNRLGRLDQIIKKLDPPAKFKPTIQRYRQTKKTFQKRLDSLETAIQDVDTATYSERKLPGDVFDSLQKLLDPFTIMMLQYQRFSALSSEPASLIYAEQTLRDAQRIAPKNPEVFYQLGRVYSRLGMDDLSSRQYLKSLRVARGQDHKREDDILSMFQDQVDSNPQSPRAHYDLAFAYYENGQNKKALDELLLVLQQKCSVPSLDGIQNAYRNGKKKRAWAMVNTVVEQRCQNKSMVQTLAVKRLNYILNGETPYYRLTYY